MSKEKKVTFIICFVIYALIILLIIAEDHNYDKWSNIGTAGLLLGIFYLLISLILLIPKQTRKVGSAILLSSGIIFLIGLSVCSVFPFKI